MAVQRVFDYRTGRLRLETYKEIAERVFFKTWGTRLQDALNSPWCRKFREQHARERRSPTANAPEADSNAT